jgi:hypothetical protein
MRYAC